MAFADRFGWEIVDRFDDNDISAFNGKTRPGFEVLLDAMKTGQIDALICWYTDRLHRIRLHPQRRRLGVGRISVVQRERHRTPVPALRPSNPQTVRRSSNYVERADRRCRTRNRKWRSRFGHR